MALFMNGMTGRHFGAIDKQRAKAKLQDARTFGEWANKWLDKAPMAESTRALRRSILIQPHDVDAGFSVTRLERLGPIHIQGFTLGVMRDS
jgi:hypothetical protein